MTRPLALLFLCWSLCLAVGCRYGLDPDVDPNRNGGGFTCAADSDCGTGWHCSHACEASGFTPVCLPTGECDPCPSLASDPLNCGACGTACAAGQACVNSACLVK